MKNRVLIPILSILIILSWSSQTFSLEEKTHRAINEYIAQNPINGFSLSDYLVNNLGLKEGAKETISGVDADSMDISQTVFEWLGYGGIQEDRPGSTTDYLMGRPTRSVNHFHNPLKAWDGAGLDDYITIPSLSPPYFINLPYTGQSSILWAQNPNQSPGGIRSWKDARRYFYSALTGMDIDGRVVAPKKQDRDRYFANTFRTVGQLMHLVEDASVPEHVRNDVHVLPAYEAKVEDFRTNKKKYPSLWNDFLAVTPGFDKSILDIVSTHSSAPIPISRIIDTDKYSGNADITRGSAIGMSEYTNANFLSPDTMFTENYNPNDRHYFPYPRAASTSRWKDDTNKRHYLRKTGDGDTVDHLALTSYLYSYRQRYFPQYDRYLPIGLDEKCYQEYASKLIPRAVGYSAGLLEYFFRGKIQVTCLPVLYKNSISSVRVKIKNITPTQEAMKNGWIALTYRYTPTGGAADGSNDIFGEAWASSESVVAPIAELKYQEDEMTVDFIVPEPIPIKNYGSVKFTLAFKGTLGNEEGAVVGKVFTPGEIKFNEEWDNGLSGSHTWAHVDFGTSGEYPGHGNTSNAIQDDILIKDNIRYVGYKNPSANASFVGNDPYYPGYEDILPILITPKTYIQSKIDKMSINQIPPAPPGSTGHQQCLWLHFNNDLHIQITQENQSVSYGPTTAIWTFQLGYVTLANIYELFTKAGIAIPEPLYLHKISFSQQLFELTENSTAEHHQHMEVDFIRIIEEKIIEEKQEGE